MDEFLIEAVSLKALEKVRVGHDSSGPGSGWFLDKVVVKDPEDSTKEYVFPCSRFAIVCLTALTSLRLYPQHSQIPSNGNVNEFIQRIFHFT